MLKCKCSGEVFTEASPLKIEAGEFRVWTLKEKLRPFTKSVPVLECVVCNRMYTPATTLQGKNALDPEVQMYKELLEVVEMRNNRIDIIDRLMLSDIFKLDLASRVSALEEQTNVLQKEVAPAYAPPPEEIPGIENVKTTDTNRRNTKKTI